LRDLDFFYI